MNQSRLFPDRPKRGDICLRRARGNRNSRAAGERVLATKDTMAERIRVYVHACGPEGATLLEVANKMWDESKQRYKYPNEISGRLTELKSKNKIFKSGRDRAGSEVMVGEQSWVNGSAQ